MHSDGNQFSEFESSKSVRIDISIKSVCIDISIRKRLATDTETDVVDVAPEASVVVYWKDSVPANTAGAQKQIE